MSMKRVKEQIAALRDDVDRQSGRKWVTIRAHPKASDDEIASWLNAAIGLDWRRHVIVRMDDTRCNTPRIEGRIVSGAVNNGLTGFALRFSEADAGLL